MRLYLLSFFLFVTLQGWAQNTGQITGKLNDSTEHKMLSLATVTVFTAADTSVITYRLSDPEGNFRVTGLPLNTPLRMVISNIGYAVYRKEFTLTMAEPKQDMGTIHLARSSRQLDEVLVIAERPPVTVKNDTIEFNASSFKTLPTALVEDLLRKMPGVQVDKQGNISYNGRPVNRILVDGKAFFGDDPKMATRNLPANVIDKVQVTDDKEQLQLVGEENANQVGKIINLRLKKGVKKGWFGKAYAGGGTGGRYEAGTIANTFRDTLQLSLLGYTNNINNSGFSFGDIQSLGGFNRSGANSISIWRSNGGSKLTVNDIAFGGANEGVAASSGAGFNLNHAPGKNTSVYLQYFYGHVNGGLNRESYNDQYFADTVLGSNYNTVKTNISNGHNMNAGIRLKPDSVTNINFRMGFTAGRETEDILSRLESLSNKDGLLSTGVSNFDNVHSSKRYNHNLGITLLSRHKKGRQLSINQVADVGRKEKDRITNSLNTFYQPVPGSYQQNQLRNEWVPDSRLNSAVTYREPLNKMMTLSLTGRHEYGKLKNEVATFLHNGTGYTIPDNNQSNQFERVQTRLSVSTGLVIKLKKLNITPGFTVMQQMIDNRLIKSGTEIDQRLFNILPRLDISVGSFSVNYSANAEAPGYENLVPVADNSNPFYIRNGNAGLEPAIKHSVNMNFYKFNVKSATNMSLYMHGGLTKNAIIQSTVIDKSGVQTITPVNADGNRNLYMNMYFSKEYKYSKKFKMTVGASANINYDRSRLIVNNNDAYQETWNLQPYFSVDFNYNDLVELRQSGGPGYNLSRFSTTDFEPLTVRSAYANTEVIIRWPWKLIWEANMSYDYNGQITGGLPRSVYLLNAAVNLQMLKEDKGTLKLSVFDALNTNSNVNRGTTANSIYNSRTNVLQRYLMLTFTYNVRAMGAGKGKVGGRERFFFF